MSGLSVRRPSPEVVAAVQESCLAVAARPVRLAEEFYAQLFAMAPQLRPMFPADMTGQMQRMTDALLGAIRQLATTDTAELEVVLHRLGADHRIRYGVESEHYLYIGHALTRAVREVAGPAYSGSLSSSWIAVYQWVAAQMTAGAESAEQLATEQAAAEQPAAEQDPSRLVLPEPRESRERDPAPGPRLSALLGSLRQRG